MRVRVGVSVLLLAPLTCADFLHLHLDVDLVLPVDFTILALDQLPTVPVVHLEMHNHVFIFKEGFVSLELVVDFLILNILSGTNYFFR